jgi:hypothetical protein
VIIPAGGSNDEIWRIAQTVNRSVSEGAEIVLDISHGPLSFSLVGLLTSFFLRTARNVRVKGIFFAAYGVDLPASSGHTGAQETQAGEPQATLPLLPGETPIFDLSPMLVWLEWYNAIERFKRTGRSRALIEQIKTEKSRRTRLAQGDRQQLILLSSMGKLAGALDGVSSALDIIRPDQVMQHAADLPERIADVKPLFYGGPASLIYEIMFESLLNEFAQISLSPETGKAHPDRVIAVQRNLINWYAERELWVEATTLAREWVVSWTMLHLGLVDFTSRRLRQRVESVLGAEAQDFLSARQHKIPYHPLFMQQIPDTANVLNLWLQLTEVRNDINHAGMRERPGRPNDLISSIKNSLATMNKLPIDPTPKAAS